MPQWALAGAGVGDGEGESAAADRGPADGDAGREVVVAGAVGECGWAAVEGGSVRGARPGCGKGRGNQMSGYKGRSADIHPNVGAYILVLLCAQW